MHEIKTRKISYLYLFIGCMFHWNSPFGARTDKPCKQTSVRGLVINDPELVLRTVPWIHPLWTHNEACPPTSLKRPRPWQQALNKYLWTQYAAFHNRVMTSIRPRPPFVTSLKVVAIILTMYFCRFNHVLWTLSYLFLQAASTFFTIMPSQIIRVFFHWFTHSEFTYLIWSMINTQDHRQTPNHGVYIEKLPREWFRLWSLGDPRQPQSTRKWRRGRCGEGPRTGNRP